MRLERSSRPPINSPAKSALAQAAAEKAIARDGRRGAIDHLFPPYTAEKNAALEMWFEYLNPSQGRTASSMAGRFRVSADIRSG